MKRIINILFLLVIFQSFGQKGIKYGLTAGLNVSSGILPELELNTNINSILKGESVVKGKPQLADFVSLYKVGVFLKMENKVITPKINISYTKTDIYKDIDINVFSVNALDIDLSYLDVDFIFDINLSKHFYISTGYVPSMLLDHAGNLDVEKFDHRLLTGFGFKFANGASIDFDAVVGLKEIIDGSYIHNFMIPISFSIPLNQL